MRQYIDFFPLVLFGIWFVDKINKQLKIPIVECVRVFDIKINSKQTKLK